MGRAFPLLRPRFLGIGFVAAAAVASSPVGTARPGRAAPRPALPFDFVVHNDELVILDTSEVVLADSHGQVLTFTNGEIFLDTLEVKAGGILWVQGPNPLRFFVSDSVKIAGTIRVNGYDAKDVTKGSLNPGIVQQDGALGVCGGGDGGTGNPELTQSSPKGGIGFGSMNALDGGGAGGESSLWAIGSTGGPCQDLEDWHPAGGGGGSFATSGEAGCDGTNAQYNLGNCSVPNGKSAVDPSHAPFGGAAGPAAFTNNDPADDHLGVTLQTSGAAAAGSTAMLLVPAGAPFDASNAGRFVGLVRKSGSWEDGTLACASPSESPITCPRSKYLLRRIQQVDANGNAVLSTPTPSPIAPGDTFMIYGTGSLAAGELKKLRAGEGGGAGGNAIQSVVLPNPGYAFDKSGAGGGGGGGILEIYCYGPIDLTGGTLTANGGHGGGGQQTIGFDYQGGGSGGGSGGMIRVQSAMAIDATNATIRAVGGERGVGFNGGKTDPVPPSNSIGMGHGGRGGMGLVQLHAPFDAQGIPMITFSNGVPSAPSFIPAPILGLPDFSDDPLRQRAMWFGIK